MEKNWENLIKINNIFCLIILKKFIIKYKYYLNLLKY